MQYTCGKEQLNKKKTIHSYGIREHKNRNDKKLNIMRVTFMHCATERIKKIDSNLSSNGDEIVLRAQTVK